MLLGCHRSADDKRHQGLMTEFNALLIGLSRGVDRFYLFTEDMRDQIFFPRSGELHREGSALCMLNVSALPEGTPAKESTAIGKASRRQMPWVRLWSESEREWKLLQVRNEFARVLGSGTYLRQSSIMVFVEG